MSDEQELRDSIKKSYAELNKVLKAKYKKYIGKSYDFNGNQYYIHGFDGRDFDVLMISEQGINFTKMNMAIEQWVEYEMPTEEFISKLETQVDLFIKQVKER